MKDEGMTNMKLSKEIKDLFRDGEDLINLAARRSDEADAAIEAAELDKEEARLMELHGFYIQGKAIRMATAVYCQDNGKPCRVGVVCHLFDMIERSANFRAKFFDDVNASCDDPEPLFSDVRELKRIEDMWTVAIGRGRLLKMSPEERAEYDQAESKKQAERYVKRKEKAASKRAISADKLAGIEQARHEGNVAQQIVADNAVRKLNALAEHADRSDGQEAERATAQIEKAAEKYGTDVETIKKVAQMEHEQQQRSKAREEMKKKFPREYEEMKQTLEERYDEMPKDRFIVFVMEYIATGGF